MCKLGYNFRCEMDYATLTKRIYKDHLTNSSFTYDSGRGLVLMAELVPVQHVLWQRDTNTLPRLHPPTRELRGE